MLRGPLATADPEANVDGFFLGMFDTDGVSGNAWIWAPDARIALLSWSTGPARPLADAPELVLGSRWGNFTVQVPLPLTTDRQARDYLSAVLPELRRRWTAWAKASA